MWIFQYVLGMILRRPPSVTMTFPLQYAPARDVRNRIQPAMSSIVPDLSAGILSLGKIPLPIIGAAKSDGYTISTESAMSFGSHLKETVTLIEKELKN